MKDEVFDPSDSKYKTCCGVCHVTTGTVMMCLVLLFVYVLALIFRIAFFPYPAFIFGGIILILVNIILIGLAIYAVKKEKPKLLIPLLIALLLGSSGSAAGRRRRRRRRRRWRRRRCLKKVGTLQQVRGTSTSDNNGVNNTFYHQRQYSSRDELNVTSLIIELLLYFVIQTWLFFVAYKCYQYLKAKKRAEEFDNYSRPDYRY